MLERRKTSHIQKMTKAAFQLSNPELEGEIYYLTEQEGGRRNPIASGYRGQFYYNGRDWDAPQILIDKEICYPGETAKIKLQMLSPNFHVGQFYVGQGFEIREGTTTVGRGKITQILRNDFNYWDFDTFLSKLSKEHQPYNFQYVKDVSTKIHHGLTSIRQISKLIFTKSLSNPYQMLTVECKLRDKGCQAQALVDEICNRWREEIHLDNSHYKTELLFSDKGFYFELTFATWHTRFLTGRIMVNTPS